MDPSVKSRPYDMSSRARQAQETRRRIVEAAARLFTRNGYSATSVSAIAEEAGVAVPTVYAALETKAAHSQGGRPDDRAGQAPAFSRFVIIRPIQSRAAVEQRTLLCAGQGGRRAVNNDPDICLITRERRGPACRAESERRKPSGPHGIENRPRERREAGPHRATGEWYLADSHGHSRSSVAARQQPVQ